VAGCSCGLFEGTVQHLLGGTEKNHENLSQGRRSVGQDINSEDLPCMKHKCTIQSMWDCGRQSGPGTGLSLGSSVFLCLFQLRIHA
jgi:hypothetical protein